MARLPARISWIVHERTGVEVALRLNKKTMQFQAEYGGETFVHIDGSEVQAKVLQAIEQGHQLVSHVPAQLPRL